MRYPVIGLAAGVLICPVAQAQIKAPLTITAEDYPRYALNAGLEGRARLSIVVRDDGTVSKCSIAESSGHGLLDDRSCELYLARSRFDPVPAQRSLTAPVTWQLDGGGVDDPLHMLERFRVSYPVRLGKAIPPGVLDVLVPGRCTRDASGALCRIDGSGAEWLGKGVARQAMLNFAPRDDRFTRIGVTIAPSRRGTARGILRARLGKPCYASGGLLGWVDAGFYATLGRDQFSVFVPADYPEPAARLASTCPPLRDRRGR